MAVIVNWNGEPQKTKAVAGGAAARPAQPRPAPPPRTTHLDSASPLIAGNRARTGRWWIWVIVAAAPAIAAGIWLWLRL